MVGEFGEQVRVAVEEEEEFDEGERGAGLAGLVAGEGVGTAAEEAGGLALIEVEFVADAGDEGGVDGGAVDLFLEVEHGGADAGGLGGSEDGFVAGGAEEAVDGGDGGGVVFVGVGEVVEAGLEGRGGAGRAEGRGLFAGFRHIARLT